MSSPKSPAVNLSVRIAPSMREELEQLAEATGRTKSFLAAEAIAHYLDIQAWQTAAVKASVTSANHKNANFVTHEQVTHWVESWGADDEAELP